MKKTTILVIQHHFTKTSTNEKLTITIEAPKEGPIYESSLFCCSSCNTLFSASDQCMKYSKTVFDQLIQDQVCPICNSKLSLTLVKIKKHFDPKVTFEKPEWKEINPKESPFTYIECFDLTA